MNKVYLVNTIDEWNNITLIGFFNDLAEATKEVKETHAELKGIDELELKEYASTFSMVFDTEVYDEDSGEYIRVFGYILDKGYLLEEINEL